MKIRIPKPSCQKCGSKNIKIYLNDHFFECNNCGEGHIIEIIWGRRASILQPRAMQDFND